MDELDELRPALHRDPRGVVERTTALVAVARACGDRAMRSRCLALRGRARRSLGEMELAEVDLRGAVAAADGPDANQLAADAHLGLAGVLAWAGRTAEAFAHLDLATELGDERTVAYASLQRASVAQRTGRNDVALAAYEAALPVLRALDLRTDQALVHMNRAMIRVTAGDLPAAFADLARAEELFAGEGNDFGVAQVRHGVGVAHVRGGDLPAALAALDDAVARFGRLGHDALDVLVDRVEALLAAGLAADAAADAADLARRFEQAGSHSLAAEARLRRGRRARR
jgi:tetratricopeptide (TPR) repeat protein